MAYRNGTVGLTYFATKSVELRTMGYALLPGFLCDSDLARANPFHTTRAERERAQRSKAGPSASAPEEIGDVIHTLQKFYISKYVQGARASLPSAQEWWNHIINEHTSDDRKNGDKGVGRYITSLAAMTSNIEKSQDTVVLCKNKAKLDVRLCLIANRLKIMGDTMSTHKIPDSGGRFLLTSRDCPRQIPHTDYEVETNNTAPLVVSQNPGYFIVGTAEEAGGLWVSEGSHRFLCLPDGTRRAAGAKAHPLEFITIPPFSVFIGRGDLIHAGAAHKDQNHPFCARYHLYIRPSRLDIPNKVHLVPDCIPTFDESTVTREEQPPGSGMEEYDSGAGYRSGVENPESDSPSDEHDDADEPPARPRPRPGTAGRSSPSSSDSSNSNGSGDDDDSDDEYDSE